MARSATIANGSILVGIDSRAQVRDFYFPYIGHSNHVSGAGGNFLHRIGVWVDGDFYWFEHDTWQISVNTGARQMSTNIVATNSRLQLKITFNDVVHNEHDIFLRSFRIENTASSKRVIKIFFAQQFRISESRRGDTGMYDPRVQSLVHYKGCTAFLIHGQLNNKSFTEYSVGIFDIEGKDGTFKDAEDGQLEGNAIEHGSVDSVLGMSCELGAGEVVDGNYWVTVGKTIALAHELHGYVLRERPERIIHSVENYWRVWSSKDDRDMSAIAPDLQLLYHKSLQVIRAHADNQGGIIASSDSEMLNQGRDNYSYVWPRDAVVAANALARGGYSQSSERLFLFLTKLIETDGYLMHKYRVDGVLGSSWHPWIRNGKVQLPIQEDETAAVIFFLWQQYTLYKNIEFIESVYNDFIEPAAEFLCAYIDEETHLPHGSYDLWEEKYGTSTYTAASVYGGLTAAAEFATMLGKEQSAFTYRSVAENIQKAILQHLYNSETTSFVKLRRLDSNEIDVDQTIDSSSYFGLGLFGVLPFSDERMIAFRAVIDATLTAGGGCVRYQGDRYYTVSDAGSPNPWVVCTMWLAQADIDQVQTLEQLEKIHERLEWVASVAGTSGILAEQTHPHTKAQYSATPLVWSHAEYVITVDEYLKKYQQLKK